MMKNARHNDDDDLLWDIHTTVDDFPPRSWSHHIHSTVILSHTTMYVCTKLCNKFHLHSPTWKWELNSEIVEISRSFQFITCCYMLSTANSIYYDANWASISISIFTHVCLHGSAIFFIHSGLVRHPRYTFHATFFSVLVFTSESIKLPSSAETGSQQKVRKTRFYL